jgi:hypothetical protein
MATGRGERSLGQLLTDLTAETTTLLRNEIALAKAEISEKVAQASGGVAMLALGGVVCFAGLLVLLDAAVFALDRLLEPLGPALAALIVGSITVLIGILLLIGARNSLKPRNLVPTRSAESLRRDQQLIKEQVP